MAKDDYFVLAYRILSYLYACFKAGERPVSVYVVGRALGNTDAFNFFCVGHSFFKAGNVKVEQAKQQGN